MPNWCDCDLDIFGKEADLQEFRKFSEGIYSDTKEKNVLDHQNFVPTPHRKLADEMKKIDMEQDLEKRKALKVLFELENNGDIDKLDWSNWTYINWGCKWGICHSQLLEETKTHLFYNFQTPWSPCYPIIIAMSKRFPKLRFKMKYFEGGVGFKGIYEVKDGNILKDEYSEKYRGGRGG